VEKHTLEFTWGEIYTPPKVERSPANPHFSTIDFLQSGAGKMHIASSKHKLLSRMNLEKAAYSVGNCLVRSSQHVILCI
jgi:hypothetical protein